MKLLAAIRDNIVGLFRASKEPATQWAIRQAFRKRIVDCLEKTVYIPGLKSGTQRAVWEDVADALIEEFGDLLSQLGRKEGQR